MRLLIAVVAVAGLLAAGCGLPFDGKSLPSTSQLINGAADNFAKATSVEIGGTFAQGSDGYTIDMELTMPNPAHITMTRNGVLIEVLQVNGKINYRGAEFLTSLAGSGAYAQKIVKAVGDRFWTSKDAAPLDFSSFSDISKVKANFFNTLAVTRKDNVSAGGVMTALLSADSYSLNITEAPPYRLVSIRTAPGKTVGELTLAQLDFSNYDHDFALQAPTNVFALDDHSTWPPMYFTVSLSNSRCNSPCTLSGVFQNDGGLSGAPAHSTVTFTLTNHANGSIFGKCKVTIRTDVANGKRVTESCTISSAAWNTFSGTYTYMGVADNPAYD